MLYANALVQAAIHESWRTAQTHANKSPTCRVNKLLSIINYEYLYLSSIRHTASISKSLSSTQYMK
jgi:hypothetical protein